ncbi:hypothetical protein ABD75_03830 [Bacillus vallismortis]|nr:hypothetical protein [Bacillus vallismortis]QAV08773.1 hypothetical protein BV11031_09300 [Bacillus vallismortis]
MISLMPPDLRCCARHVKHKTYAHSSLHLLTGKKEGVSLKTSLGIYRLNEEENKPQSIDGQVFWLGSCSNAKALCYAKEVYK